MRFEIKILIEMSWLGLFGCCMAGPRVCCLMLKSLLESPLETLLGVFNCIWTAGGFPGGLDIFNGDSYSQARWGILRNLIIALTGCLCKTLERLIKDLLGF